MSGKRPAKIVSATTTAKPVAKKAGRPVSDFAKSDASASKSDASASKSDASASKSDASTPVDAPATAEAPTVATDVASGTVASTPAESAPASTPATSDSAPAVTPSESENAKAERQKKAKQYVVGPIPSARVRKMMDDMGVNSAVHKLVAPLKEQRKQIREAKNKLGKLEPSKTGKPLPKPREDLTPEDAQKILDELGPHEAELDSKIKALNESRRRFSENASMPVVALIEVVAGALTKVAMENALLSKKKIVEVSAIPLDSTLYAHVLPLLRLSPTFLKAVAEIQKACSEAERTQLVKSERKDAAKQAVAEYREKYGLKKNPERADKAEKAEKQAEKQATEEKQADKTAIAEKQTEQSEKTEKTEKTEKQADENDDGVNIQHHLVNVYNNVKFSNESLKDMRVSASYKEFMHQVLLEVVHALNQVIVSVMGITGGATVNEPIVKTAILMVYRLSSPSRTSIEYGQAHDESAFAAEKSRLDALYETAKKAYEASDKKGDAPTKQKVDESALPRDPSRLVAKYTTVEGPEYQEFASKCDAVLKAIAEKTD